MASGLSKTGPGCLLGEVCRGCAGERSRPKLWELAEDRDAKATGDAFIWFWFQVFQSFKTVIEYAGINPGFLAVCCPAVCKQNLLASCTAGHLNFIGHEAEHPSALCGSPFATGDQYLEPHTTGHPGPLSEPVSALTFPLPQSLSLSHFLQAGMWFLHPVDAEKGRRHCWEAANSLPPSLLLSDSVTVASQARVWKPMLK